MSGSDSRGAERLAPVSYLPGAFDGAGQAADATPDRSTPAVGDRARRRAENVSMAALTRRAYSRAELESLLLDRGLDESAVELELDRLAGVGLVDDDALAAELVDRLRSRKSLGRTAIAAELGRRRLPPTAVERALADIDADDEFESAAQLARKRAAQLSSYDDVTALRRLVGYLARRGYSTDVATRAARAALASA